MELSDMGVSKIMARATDVPGKHKACAYGTPPPHTHQKLI